LGRWNPRLLDAKGREANWFWRWKFRTVDNNVKFDPAKYGWSWVPGTTSWVIPTAFTLVTLQQVSDMALSEEPGINERIGLGIRMLLDRICPGGGWNAGNSMAFGVRYAPYKDATSIALLALSSQAHESGVQASLSWLAVRLAGCPSPYSLVWGILALTAYGQRNSEANDALPRATDALIAAIGKDTSALDTSTLAICLLALEAVEGHNVFEVWR
jgi:hypothetical protein